jgi:hypothetical protein
MSKAGASPETLRGVAVAALKGMVPFKMREPR